MYELSKTQAIEKYSCANLLVKVIKYLERVCVHIWKRETRFVEIHLLVTMRQGISLLHRDGKMLQKNVAIHEKKTTPLQVQLQHPTPPLDLAIRLDSQVVLAGKNYYVTVNLAYGSLPRM